MTEQPAEPEDKGQNDQPRPKPKPNPWTPSNSFLDAFNAPPRRPPVDPYRFSGEARRAPDDFVFQKDPYRPTDSAEALTDAMLAALGLPPKAGERPPVELSQERRAHVAQRSAEFHEWQKNGFTRQEALAIVSMEIQLEHRFKKGGGV